MSLILDRLPRCLVRHSKGRVLMFLGLAIPLGLQWWTWWSRNPALTEAHADIKAIESLASKVEDMERNWPQEEAEKAEAMLAGAKAKLFPGTPESGAWSEEVNHPQEADSAIPTRVSLPETPRPHPNYPERLLVAPTLWDLDLKAAKDPGSDGILAFLQGLTENQEKRMDFVYLSVVGDGSKLSKVEVGFDLWFLQEETVTP